MCKPRLIGITGKIGSGKSSLAEYFKTLGYEEYAIAEPIKKIGEIFGFTKVHGTQEEKMEIHPYWKISAREFLQKFGTELCRDALPSIIPNMKIETSIWLEIFKIKYNSNPNVNYVISDVRFEDEAECIKKLNGIIIQTVRDVPEQNHKSELSMNNIIPDIIVNNNILSIEESREFVYRTISLENNSKKKEVVL
jgi:energy-coupling factor transporter ATP-binding protein EcfA2